MGRVWYDAPNNRKRMDVWTEGGADDGAVSDDFASPQSGRGGVENNDSTDIESPPPPPPVRVSV